MGRKKRCSWALGSELMLEYHDLEWGVPVHDDRKLFEFLILEGAQAGLSWETVLKKRENYRKAFNDFDPVRISRYTDQDIERLLANPGIIRNRLKVMATRANAQGFLKTQEELGSFENYIWQFVGGTPIKNRFESLSDLPSKTRESEAMSGNLRGRGFRFVGPTICYAFMQAVGMVNDHTTDCFRYGEV
ncbi:MAG: DNA-3-methyladenine glycosylase I [Candidatus Thermoplasmatota archaeon]|nr:DNA-3-methyladenine glycosylase I [Candidatus Thermoplasmatota archaeon]